MLQLITILNRCHRFPGFVYRQACFSSDHKSIEIAVRPRKGSAAVCSRCHQPAPGYDQLPERRFEFIPFWGFLVFLLYSMRRVNCPRCQTVVVEEVPWGDGKRTLTKAYMLFLARWARRLSWKETAEAFRTSWDKVFDAVEHVVTFGLEHRVFGQIDAIGVDEIQYAKGHKYLTLVYQIDLDVTRLLWVGRERTIESFRGFFTVIGDELASKIVFVCSDSLSSAVNNMSNLEEFNQRYEGLMRYYGVKPQHTNPASPNENGDAEQSHHRFKRAVEQALLLRGSREFGSLAEYAQFLKDLFAQRNAGRRVRLSEEMALMGELPARRMESAKRERVRVDSGSLIHVERNSYSVNSRLIGARVEARLYLDHVEVWYGQRKVEDLPRLRGRSKHRIDYRHIIEWLLRKPGAFENDRYQEDLFPTSRFRMAYDALKETTPSRSSKEYLKILKLAAEAGEVPVDEALRELLEGKAETVITVESIGEVLAKLDTIPPVTMVEVTPVDLASFDQLCTEMGVRQ